MTPDRAAAMRLSQLLFLAVAAWGMAAIAVTASGTLAEVPRPALPLTIGVLAAAAVGVMLSVPRLRWWVRRAEPRWLVGFHLVRFIGAYFVYLTARERLPEPFVYAGWADIAVAVWALALVTTGLGRSTLSLLIWNIIGLLDILAVVTAATRLGLRAPDSIAELTRLPLGLLPTFVVPVIIASHVLLFVRLGMRPPAMDRVRPIRLETA